MKWKLPKAVNPHMQGTGTNDCLPTAAAAIMRMMSNYPNHQNLGQCANFIIMSIGTSPRDDHLWILLLQSALADWGYSFERVHDTCDPTNGKLSPDIGYLARLRSSTASPHCVSFSGSSLIDPAEPWVLDYSWPNLDEICGGGQGITAGWIGCTKSKRLTCVFVSREKWNMQELHLHFFAVHHEPMCTARRQSPIPNSFGFFWLQQHLIMD